MGLNALLPLLATTQKTLKLDSTADVPAALRGKEILVPSGNSMAALMPLMLLSGDSSSSGGGGAFGGSDNMMMMVLLLTTLNK